MRKLLIFFYPTETNRSEFVKYLIGGGLAYTVDFLLLIFLTEFLGVPVLISAAVSFIIGLIIIYLLSIKWIFENRIQNNSYQEFFIFSFIGIIGLLINEILIWTSISTEYVHYTVAKIMSAGLVFIWNFSARKFILFRSED
jgi:putative flippase GtrA